MKENILNQLSVLTGFEKKIGPNGEEAFFPEVITFEKIQNSKFNYNKELGTTLGEFELEDLLSEILKTEEGKFIIAKSISSIIFKNKK